MTPNAPGDEFYQQAKAEYICPIIYVMLSSGTKSLLSALLGLESLWAKGTIVLKYFDSATVK